MKKLLPLFILAALVSCAAPKATLSLESQFDWTAADLSASYLTVKGSGESVEKDTIDVATGASLAKGTEVLNSYRNDADGKNTLPGGIQSLLKYGVSPAVDFATDNLQVAQAADGVITVQYIHRGTAYKMVSDASGVFALPGNYQKRAVGALVNEEQIVSKDFSATGLAKDADWAKIWDASVPAGTLVATVKNDDGTEKEFKTGEVVADVAASAKAYTGSFQLTLTGSVLNIKGDLSQAK